MIFEEYSYEDDIRVQRKEAYDDGIMEGMKQGISAGIAQQKAKDEKRFAKITAQKDALISTKDAENQRLREEIAQLKAKLQ